MRRTIPTLSALIGFTLFASTAAQANYQQKAEEQTDFIQSHFYDVKAKRYHQKFPVDPKDLPYDFMWANGVQFTALVGAAQHNPKKYKRWLYAFREGLQTYWDPQAPVPGFNAYCSGPGGTDKYYDDNEWLVLGEVEAYEVTDDPMFRRDAERTQRFVLSGWDDVLGGGIYWKLDHKSKNTCSNAPATAAALRLYQISKNADQLDWARKIRAWLNPHLQDPKDGLYWDNVNLEGKIGRAKYTYNTALMIRADVLFAQVGGEPEALDEARRLADAGLAAWTDPATGSLHKTEDGALFTHLFCESLLRLYDATHDLKYLNAVRREASFAYRHVRDTENGGYYSHWKDDRHPDDRKSLIESASVARLYWLLTPYADVEELYQSGIQAASKNDDTHAERFLRQTVDSDNEAVEAHYRLWKVLRRERKTTEAAAEEARMEILAQDPAKRDRLTALGWKSSAV